MIKKENQIIDKKKILVMGVSICSKEITSYLWEKLPQDLNFADFNVVILDMTRFEDSGFINTLPNDDLLKSLNFENLLFCKNNEIVVIGNPFFYTKPSKLGGEFVFEFASHFPYYPESIDVKGESIKILSKEFDFYFVNVKHWNWHLKSNIFEYKVKVENLPNFISNNYKAMNLRDSFINITPIAMTLTSHPIAFSFRQSFFGDQNTSSIISFINICTANIINLPPPTTISIEEAIKSILSNRYKISLEKTAPEWVGKYKTCIQIKMDSVIANLHDDKLKIESDIQAQINLLKSEEIFQRLLFEQSAILQSVTQDALELLGAKVDRMDEKKDDGKFVIPNGKSGILEIKSSKKTIALDDVLQLDNWKAHAEEKDGIERKGILIANCYIEKDISERGEYFPDNCIKKAEKNDFCLLKTTQLFKAVCLFREGKLDVEDFWEKVFSTNGKCKISDL